MNDSLWSEVDEEAGQRMIKTNGVDLCTQAFGDPVDPGMLLIMGTTASMVRWPETLCRQLATQACMSSDMTTGTPEPRPAMPPTPPGN
jgi:hypothetical protein